MNSITELNEQDLMPIRQMILDNCHTGVFDDECWVWLGNTNAQGYGQVKIPSKSLSGHTWTSVHRLMYILAREDIPEKMLVRHTCDEPMCCNPKHLLLGTHYDNSRDKIMRQGTQIMKRLTTKEIENVFEMYYKGYDYKDIAQTFEVPYRWMRDFIEKTIYPNL